MENKNAKIIIKSKGNLKFVNIDGVDIENHGVTNMSEIDMKNNGYSNEESGTTNIEGKLNTDGFIINKGAFNIQKTGYVNIFRKGVLVAESFWQWVLKNVVVTLFIAIVAGLFVTYLAYRLNWLG